MLIFHYNPFMVPCNKDINLNLIRIRAIWYTAYLNIISRKKKFLLGRLCDCFKSYTKICGYLLELCHLLCFLSHIIIMCFLRHAPPTNSQTIISCVSLFPKQPSRNIKWAGKLPFFVFFKTTRVFLDLMFFYVCVFFKNVSCILRGRKGVGVLLRKTREWWWLGFLFGNKRKICSINF